MKLTKKDIETAGLPPELTAELLSLFDDVTAKETEIAALRSKVPTDSQKVVDSVDHEKFIAATKELEKLKQEIAEKLQTEDTIESMGFLAQCFPALFK